MSSETDTIKFGSLSASLTSADRLTVKREDRTQGSLFITIQSNGPQSRLTLKVACLDPTRQMRLAQYGAKWFVNGREGSSVSYVMELLRRLSDAQTRSGSSITAGGECFGRDGLRLKVDESSTTWTLTDPTFEREMALTFQPPEAVNSRRLVEGSADHSVKRDTEVYSIRPIAQTGDAEASASAVNSDDSDVPLAVSRRRKRKKLAAAVKREDDC